MRGGSAARGARAARRRRRRRPPAPSLCSRSSAAAPPPPRARSRPHRRRRRGEQGVRGVPCEHRVRHAEEPHERVHRGGRVGGLQRGQRALGEVEQQQRGLHVLRPRRREPRLDELGRRGGERGAALAQHVDADLVRVRVRVRVRLRVRDRVWRPGLGLGSTQTCWPRWRTLGLAWCVNSSSQRKSLSASAVGCAPSGCAPSKHCTQPSAGLSTAGCSTWVLATPTTTCAMRPALARSSPRGTWASARSSSLRTPAYTAGSAPAPDCRLSMSAPMYETAERSSDCCVRISSTAASTTFSCMNLPPAAPACRRMSSKMSTALMARRSRASWPVLAS